MMTRLRASQHRFSMAVRRTDAVHARGDSAVDRDQVVSRSNLPIVAFALTGYSSVLCGGTCRRDASALCAEFVAALPPQRADHRYLSISAASSRRPVHHVVRVLGECSSISSAGSTCPEDILKVLALAHDRLVRMRARAVPRRLSEKSESVEKLWHPAVLYLLSALRRGIPGRCFRRRSALCASFFRWFTGSKSSRGLFRIADRGPLQRRLHGLFNSMLTLLGLAQVRKVSRTVVPE